MTCGTSPDKLNILPEGDRGDPRIQYKRTYVLLPPGANSAWARAVAEATWDSKRYTLGGSADDAGIGKLLDKNVICVNPRLWDHGDETIEDFFPLYYPGTRVTYITASTPQDLYNKLTTAPLFAIGLHDGGGLDYLRSHGVIAPALVHFPLEHVPTPPLDFTTYPQPVYLRVNWNYGGVGTLSPFSQRQRWVEVVAQTISESRGLSGVHIGNEVNNPDEWNHQNGLEVLTPEIYVRDYYNPVCALLTDCDVPIAPSPIDPYNVVAGQYGSQPDPKVWAEVIYYNADRIDWLPFHAKTQTSDLNECVPGTPAGDRVFTDAPLIGRYMNLRTIEDQLSWVPSRLKGLPRVICELNPQRKLDGSLGWDANGPQWVKLARSYLSQFVDSAILYRYDKAGDQTPFGLRDRPDILSILGGA